MPSAAAAAVAALNESEVSSTAPLRSFIAELTLRDEAGA